MELWKGREPQQVVAYQEKLSQDQAKGFLLVTEGSKFFFLVPSIFKTQSSS